VKIRKYCVLNNMSISIKHYTCFTRIHRVHNVSCGDNTVDKPVKGHKLYKIQSSFSVLYVTFKNRCEQICGPPKCYFKCPRIDFGYIFFFWFNRYSFIAGKSLSRCFEYFKMNRTKLIPMIF